MDAVPEGSIYFWMYVQGLKHTPYDEVEAAVHACGKVVRKKDYENYQNGWRNSRHNHDEGERDPFEVTWTQPVPSYFLLKYENYLKQGYKVAPRNRWVPCAESGKPLLKWSQESMTKDEALKYPQAKWLAENLKDTSLVVFDVDGDHDPDNLDLEIVRFMSKYMDVTHCISKPKTFRDYGLEGEDPVLDLPTSFHLAFLTDRSIPTMHFMSAHLDIIGNRGNGLRFWKNKVWNGKRPVVMTDEIWSDIQSYVKRRELH